MHIQLELKKKVNFFCICYCCVVVAANSETMSSHQLMQIEKLKGRENFETWKVAAKSYFAIKELWKFVDPSETSTVTPDQNLKATAELTLLIQPIHYPLIAEATTARAAWTILVDTFKDTGTSRKVNTLQRLVTLKKSDCTSMEDYCSKMMEYWLKVKNVGFAIDSETVGALMLGTKRISADGDGTRKFWKGIECRFRAHYIVARCSIRSTW